MVLPNPQLAGNGGHPHPRDDCGCLGHNLEVATTKGHHEQV